jgi:hypothetical protein
MIEPPLLDVPREFETLLKRFSRQSTQKSIG